MKQILLMRHAKSSWAHENLSDFDRPLEQRGINDTPMMGKFIRESGFVPDLVISSPAQRAKETTRFCAESANIENNKITWNKELYFGSVRDYVMAIQSASDTYERIMLVGHNPLMEHTAGVLTGAEQGTAVRMPTAALLCIESFASTWDNVSPGSCQIKWMMIPKVLKKML